MEAQGLNKRKINNLFTLKNAVWETSPEDKNLSQKKFPVTPRPIVCTICLIVFFTYTIAASM